MQKSINSGGVSENFPNSGGSSNSSNSNNNSSNRSSNNQNSQNGQGNSGINIYTENESDFWVELKETLTAFVGTEAGRSVIVSPQAGLVTVRGLPAEIEAVRKFIAEIEAKIMEVTLNDEYQQGVHWNEVLGSIGKTDFTFSTSGNINGNAISSNIGGATSLSFSAPDFSGVIDLLQTQGNVQVLSSPRITATNNQKAVIKVGEDEYFVTDVSSTTTTGTSTTTTPLR